MTELAHSQDSLDAEVEESLSGEDGEGGEDEEDVREDTEDRVVWAGSSREHDPEAGEMIAETDSSTEVRLTEAAASRGPVRPLPPDTGLDPALKESNQSPDSSTIQSTTTWDPSW